MLSVICSQKFSYVLQRILHSKRSCINVAPALIRFTCNPAGTKTGPCGGSSKPPASMGGSGSKKGKHQITYKHYVAPCYKDHDLKNMTLKRPMSPHLTIYAPTVPAMTSILQRITGIIVTFYAVMLSAGTLFLSNGVESYVSMIQSLDLSRPLIIILKLMLGAPFAFHYFFGIRFCIWNAGKWLTKKEVTSTVRVLAIATAITTVLFGLI